MESNELLFWLSARVEGSWAQFRSAVEEILSGDELQNRNAVDGLPVHQLQRFNLQSLSHVEFDAEECSDGWRVTPPVLALSGRAAETCFGVLCGARLPSLVQRLTNAAKNSLDRQTLPRQPDVIRATAVSREGLFELAEQGGIAVQDDAPASILSCLPRIGEFSRRSNEHLPIGKDWEVSMFSMDRRSSKWTKISVEHAGRIRDGLLQFKRFQTPEYYLVASGRVHRIQGQVGKYVLLAQIRKRALRYDGRSRTVVVPAIFKPPLLVERALILCSGFLPQFDPKRRTLTYRDIPESIAAMAAEILRQPGI